MNLPKSNRREGDAIESFSLKEEEDVEEVYLPLERQRTYT